MVDCDLLSRRYDISYSGLSSADISVSTDLSEDAKRSLIEDYSNSKSFSDGLIFRKIVEYKLTNRFAERHWWSWLTDSKRDILSRIFEHSGFSTALCNLLRIPALLDDLNISLWHKIIATLSDEVSD